MTHDFNGLTIEKGANWIEGVGGKKLNPIIPIAKRIKLKTARSDFDNTTNNIYGVNGTVDVEVAAAASKRIEELYESTETLGVSLANSNESDVNVLTAQRFFTGVPSEPVEMVLDYYHNDYEFAEPPRVTSLKSTQPLSTFEDFGEDLYFVSDPRGYKSVVHELANSYLRNKNGTITDPRLKLKKTVRMLEFALGGVRVTTEDGSVYTADNAIVSVSIGVLQSTLIDFVPDLPFWKLKAIYSFNMAVYMKIFLKFPSCFWDTNPGAKFFLYSDERRGHYPIWENLDSEFPGENVLMVTVTDEEARRIEQQPDSETLDEIMIVLRNMFPGKDVPTADSIYVPKWFSDPLFRGSFSNWPIGVDDLVFKRLQAPIQSVYFTGEHTSPEYNGYVHGAYLTGISTADALWNCKYRGKCAPTIQAELKLEEEFQGLLDLEREKHNKKWAHVLAKLEAELELAKRLV
jgi:polyamine oxidase